MKLTRGQQALMGALAELTKPSEDFMVAILTEAARVEQVDPEKLMIDIANDGYA